MPKTETAAKTESAEPRVKAKPRRSRAARLLEKAVKKHGSYEKATDDLNKATGGTYLRASVWHWSTGQHKPSRTASYDLEKWAGIGARDWDA